MVLPYGMFAPTMKTAIKKCVSFCEESHKAVKNLMKKKGGNEFSPAMRELILRGATRAKRERSR